MLECGLPVTGYIIIFVTKTNSRVCAFCGSFGVFGFSRPGCNQIIRLVMIKKLSMHSVEVLGSLVF